MIPKHPQYPDIVGFWVSISRGLDHQHNYEIKFADHIAFFFPIRKYIQAAATLPNSRASHRMCSDDTGKLSKIQPSPCFNSFLPPNRCCRPGKEATCVTLTPQLMAIFSGDQFFWIPSIILLSSLRQPLAGLRDWGPSLKRWRRLLPPHLSANPALRAASVQHHGPRPW